MRIILFYYPHFMSYTDIKIFFSFLSTLMKAFFSKTMNLLITIYNKIISKNFSQTFFLVSYIYNIPPPHFYFILFSEEIILFTFTSKNRYNIFQLKTNKDFTV